LREQLKGFVRLWKGRVVTSSLDLLRCEVHLPDVVRDRYPGCQTRVALDVWLNLPRTVSDVRTEIEVHVRCPRGNVAEQQMLRAVGPLVLQRLRKHLDAQVNHRQADRIDWPDPVFVRPVWVPGSLVGEPIPCRGKDLSLEGIGFHSPVELPAALLLLVTLDPDGQEGPLVFPAQVVRAQSCEQGYEVGAHFRWEDEPLNLIPSEA
jgi:hypothetical protein